ncbi:MAG: rod shape-determining protein RodA [Armatimonadota bacterium]
MLRDLRHADFQMLVVVLVLCIIGAAAIYSCTKGDLAAAGRPGASKLQLQLAWLVIGLCVLVGTMLVDPNKLQGLAWPIYLFVMGLLVIVLAAGAVRGTTRWLALGPINLQPSELAKLAVIVMLGAVVARVEEDKWDFVFLLKTLGYVAVPAVLILLQPDLGTPIVLFFIWLVMMFIYGASPAHLGAFVLAGIMLFAGAWGFDLIKPHQKARLTAFIYPERDPYGAAYHLHQSLIAIGSGHLWGQGLFQGKQSQSAFIPDQETDFVFTVVGEELGFVGAAMVLVLYGLLLYRGIGVAAGALTTFDRVVAAGIVAMFLIQIYANIGMTIGLAPIKGMPLPFLSYGGSSLVANMMAIGILQSIYIRREQMVF